VSKAAEFPFQIVRSRVFGLIQRPTILATMCGPRGASEALFLLDSGADISLVSHSFGQQLGLTCQGALRGACRGVGPGLVEYQICPVQLRVQHIQLRVRVGWCLTDEFPFLLGRLDVFDQLDIEFRQSANSILLRPAATGTRG